jgi:hypothetical protein
MSFTIARLVKTLAGVFAVGCEDGNGPVGEGEDNRVSLIPVSEHAEAYPDADTLASGWYLVRVNRLLAQGTIDNTGAAAGLRSVIAHPNSEYLGATISASTFTKFGRDGRWVNVLDTSGDAYMGSKIGASPGGWTIVYFDGN